MTPPPETDTARWRDLLTPTLAPRAALILLGVWLNAADSLVTATIMPSVARDLGGWAYFGWAVAGYLAGSILAGASAGQLSHRLGLRPAIIIAALVYGCGCVLSAVAPDIAVFLVGRGLQGIGSGWIVGFCYVAMGVVFPERLLARIFAAAAGVWGIAGVLGPLVGGLFATAGHWRGAFWMFAVQSLLFAIAAIPLLSGAKPNDGEPERPFAWRTLGILGLAISAVAWADVATGPRTAIALVVLGLILLAAAGRVNLWPGERLVPRDVARPTTVAGAGYLMIFMLEVATTAFAVYGAAVLQIGYGLSPLITGYVVGVLALAWTAAALIVASQPDRRQRLLIRTGTGLIFFGVALLALIIGDVEVWLVIGAAGMIGVGFGLAWSLALRRILAAVPPEDRGIAASAAPTTQLIGGAVGAAMAGALANVLGLSHAFTAQQALRAAPWLFGAFVPIAGLGWLAALRLTRDQEAAASA